MSGKSFFVMLVAVLVLGGSLGGAFVGGIALGKGQEDADTPAATIQQANAGLAQALGNVSTNGAGQTSLDQIRQRIQSGEVTPEELARLREQLQERAGGGGGAFGGFAGRAGGTGLTGTVESIEGPTLTINTTQGPLQAFIAEDTVIQMFSQVEPEELETGAQVTVLGERREDGVVVARTIVLAPEGIGGLLGGRGRGFFGGQGGAQGFPGEQSGALELPEGRRAGQRSPGSR